jgi:predicted ATPase
VAEKQLELDNTAFYFCEMDKGHSDLSLLELDKYGNISNWPRDFFGDQFGEMAEMTKAAMARKALER